MRWALARSALLLRPALRGERVGVRGSLRETDGCEYAVRAPHPDSRLGANPTSPREERGEVTLTSAPPQPKVTPLYRAIKCGQQPVRSSTGRNASRSSPSNAANLSRSWRRHLT